MTDKADASKINQSAVQKKRGRKSKKELELASQAQSAENINVVIEESACDNCDATENTVLSSAVDNTEDDGANDTNIFLSTDNSVLTEDAKPVAKKRGRKPKGGKIIQQVVPTNNNLEPKPNVILHLKCSIKDLQTNSVNGSDIQSFDIQHQAHLSYEMMNHLNKFRNKNYYDETTGNCHKVMDKVVELYKEHEHGTELVKDIEKVYGMQHVSPRAKEFLKHGMGMIKGH